jgi:hypothetical protein
MTPPESAHDVYTPGLSLGTKEDAEPERALSLLLPEALPPTITKKFVDGDPSLLNRHMIVALPPIIHPEPYDIRWIGQYLEPPSLVRPTRYYPQEMVDYRNVVEVLWDGVCDYEVNHDIWLENGDVAPCRMVERNNADHDVCCRFDHVDLLRLIYISLVCGESLSTYTSPGLHRITKILNTISRPAGYEPTLDIRGPLPGLKSNFTFEEIKRLFEILNNTKYHERDAAFQRVLQWEIDGVLANLVLWGLPEAILDLQEKFPFSGPLAWEEQPFEFMYRWGPDEQGVISWYQENAVRTE